jgi:hypothetical protein
MDGLTRIEYGGGADEWYEVISDEVEACIDVVDATDTGTAYPYPSLPW